MFHPPPPPCQYIEYLRNLRHVQVRGDGSASFELEMELKDPTSRIFLYKVRWRISQVERTFPVYFCYYYDYDYYYYYYYYYDYYYHLLLAL